MKIQRYIGLIDWFGTADGAKYGFIKYNTQDNQNSSIFFHKNQIAIINQSAIDRFFENAVVTFIIKNSEKKKSKLEAFDVILLESDTDFDFLYSEYLYLLKNDINHKISEKLLKRIKSDDAIKYLENNSILLDEISNVVFNKIEANNEFLADGIKLVQDITKQHSVIQNLLKLIIENIYKNKITLNTYVTTKDFFEIIHQYGFSDELKKCLGLCNLNILEDLWSDKYSNHNITFLTEDLKQEILNLIIKHKDFSQILENQSRLDGFFKKVAYNNSNYYFDDIFECLDNKQHLNFLLYNKNYISNQQYTYILEKFIKKQNIYTSFDDAGITKLLKIIKNRNLNHLINDVLNALNLKINFKINLWLDGLIDEFDFDLYSQYLEQLSSKYQQKFIKKVFFLIFKQQLSLNIDKILALPTTDYSTKVVFVLIKRILSQELGSKKSLKYDLLQAISSANLAIHAEDVIHINGYFNLCKGRFFEKTRDIDISVQRNSYRTEHLYDGKIIDGKQYFYQRNDIEKFNSKAILCDGQLSVKNNKPNLSSGQCQFWWCKNKQCFHISRRYVQDSDDWENYTLLDFLRILNINFDDEMIGTFYASINHINKFLSHMNCRNCGKLLKPKGSSNYTFYQVSTFFCDNNECSNPDKDVYISHCSNYYCSGTIDSRISKKCENGWVICNECFACCDDKRLKQRNINRLINGFDEIDWQPAHRGKSILCPNCAKPMQHKDVFQKRQEYDLVIVDLERLARLNIPTNDKLVSKCGTNRLGGKWFLVHQRHLAYDEFIENLNYWQSLGFNIPDLEASNKNFFLVAEHASEKKDKMLNQVTNFHCPNCQKTYDYSNESEKYAAVRYWHYSDLTRI